MKGNTEKGKINRLSKADYENKRKHLQKAERKNIDKKEICLRRLKKTTRVRESTDVKVIDQKSKKQHRQKADRKLEKILSTKN